MIATTRRKNLFCNIYDISMRRNILILCGLSVFSFLVLGVFICGALRIASVPQSEDGPKNWKPLQTGIRNTVHPADRNWIGVKSVEEAKFGQVLNRFKRTGDSLSLSQSAAFKYANKELFQILSQGSSRGAILKPAVTQNLKSSSSRINFSNLLLPHMKFMKYFDNSVDTVFLEDVSNRAALSGLSFSMFKAMIEIGGIVYSCERLYVNGTNALLLTISSSREQVIVGQGLEAEDPRMVIVRGKVYVVFGGKAGMLEPRSIGLFEFHKREIIFLQIENLPQKPVEKNWVPFEREGELYLVYSLDPLVVLHYDLSNSGTHNTHNRTEHNGNYSVGTCTVAFAQNNVSPSDVQTDALVLRGGSNFLPFVNGTYVGAAHSRIAYPDTHMFMYFTHMVLLDTNAWRLTHVAKPLHFYMEDDVIRQLNLHMRSSARIIQYPVSLLPMTVSEDARELGERRQTDTTHLQLTLNVGDRITLLYGLHLHTGVWMARARSPLHSDEKASGYWDEITRKQTMDLLLKVYGTQHLQSP